MTAGTNNLSFAKRIMARESLKRSIWRLIAVIWNRSYLARKGTSVLPGAGPGLGTGQAEDQVQRGLCWTWTNTEINPWGLHRVLLLCLRPFQPEVPGHYSVIHLTQNSDATVLYNITTPESPAGCLLRLLNRTFTVFDTGLLKWNRWRHVCTLVVA
jgi:hypothetical protein